MTPINGQCPNWFPNLHLFFSEIKMCFLCLPLLPTVFCARETLADLLAVRRQVLGGRKLFFVVLEPRVEDPAAIYTVDEFSSQDHSSLIKEFSD